MFPDDAAAERWFVETRWPDGERGCPHCGSVSTYEVKSRKPQPYRCHDCRKYFSVKTGDSHARLEPGTTGLGAGILPSGNWTQGDVLDEAPSRPGRPRVAALVFEAARPASVGADGLAGLAGTIGSLPGAGRVAALWLAAPGTGPSGGQAGRGGDGSRRRPAMSARADTSDPAAVRRRQLLLFSVIAAVLLVAVAAWLGMGGGKPGCAAKRHRGGDRRTGRGREGLDAALGGAARRDRDANPRAPAGSADAPRRQRPAARQAGDRRGGCAFRHRPPGGDHRRAEARAGAATGRRGRAAEPASGEYFRVAGEHAVGRRGAASAAPLAPVPMIETFDLEGRAAILSRRSPHRPRARGRRGGEAGVGVAAGGRPCRGRGARGGRRLRRGQQRRAIRARFCCASPAPPGPRPRTAPPFRSTSTAAR